ncbi:MAG TPA: membrane protein insertase YidC [Ktedonobacterales bacterium]
MGSGFSGILSFFGTLFSPITTVFHWVFYLPVFNILILIFHLVNNFALAIVLLTLLIRFALYPLTRKQLASTRKMQELQPRLKALQAQHRGDPQAAMAAQKELYKEHGVSMYGGCLPLLIQMPFLYALFYACEALLPSAHTPAQIAAALLTVNSQIYSFLPKLTALPPTHFFWTNLATPDQLYILPIIAGILTFIQMRMAVPVTRPGAAKDATSSTTKNMQYIMPLFTIFIGTRFPAGLALYWCISTGFSAAQQYLLSGWGSFWVGVPGMEHLVPAPKEVAPAVIAAPRGAGRGAVIAAPQPEKPAGFLANMRDMWQQMREQTSAQALVAQDQRAANNGANGARVVEAGAGSGAASDVEASQPRANQPSQRDRRPRAPKSGAMLVRPADQSGSQGDTVDSAAELEASASAENPEDRLKRDAQEPINGMIADAGSRSSGSNGANGASKSNGSNGSTSGRSGNNSSNQRRNQQSRGRNRKGGR